jgi:hypothetical protein
MSYYDYRVSREIAAQDFPFYALIQAAMRKADTANSAKLRAAWPEVWDELQSGRNSPGGLLDGDR